MIIGIDASRANKSNKTGTEWYSWHLIEELKKIVSAGDNFKLYTNDKLIGDLGVLPDGFIEKDLLWPPKYLWTQIRLWWELWKNPPDVLLVPAHTIPFLPLPKKIKVCVNVHDVGFKRFSELYKPIQVWYHDLTMRRIKSRADIIITISEFSKREIMELYQVSEEKIRVVYLGFDGGQFYPCANALTNVSDAVIPTEAVTGKVEGSLNNNASDSLSAQVDPIASGLPDSSRNDNGKKVLLKYHITAPYLLYVGRLEKKKNIGRMISAYVIAKEKHPDLKLVLAGAGGNQFEEIKQIIADNKLESEVIITGYVASEDLATIYNRAEIFLFPTLYEGFGLPILEAMASGVPVITSNQAPHTEVGGDAAIYANALSAESLADGIIKILDDEQLRQSLKEKGLERVKEFSWRKTAEEIYKMIKL